MTLAATWPYKGAILPMPLRGSGVPGPWPGPRIYRSTTRIRGMGPYPDMGFNGHSLGMGYLGHGPGALFPSTAIGEPTDGLRGSPMLYEEWALSSRRESLTRP